MFNFKFPIFCKKLKKHQTLAAIGLFIFLMTFTFVSNSQASGEHQNGRWAEGRTIEKRSVKNVISEEESKCLSLLSTTGFSDCPDFCSVLAAKLKQPKEVYNWKTINLAYLGGLFVIILITTTLTVIQCWRLKPKEVCIAETAKTTPSMEVTAPSLPRTIMDRAQEDSTLIETSAKPKSGESDGGGIGCEDKYSLEDAGDPEKAVAKPEDLIKLQQHMNRMDAQQKSDTRSDKFIKRGKIYIPIETHIPPASVLPNNVILDKVTYNPSANEIFDIGSDIDDIEMEPSTMQGSDSGGDPTDKSIADKTPKKEVKVETPKKDGNMAKASPKVKKTPVKTPGKQPGRSPAKPGMEDVTQLSQEKSKSLKSESKKKKDKVSKEKH
ncbi:uncharacterized protein CELE_T28F12.1 [Caenorhabditis elegans]|uniref:Transmembrane protein n=1 Tax=Caenorhabditis elegans TaxID=6239 RepID=Q9N5D4_CAEEL|nr:Transmembrane protein [Caenorhabditis elegans]CCD72260.2 Transmembrane protein [Caenorhabditis elegans]|eukprot:NP_001343675.1 Uncharacterized protein CELE_T28F12.1 [Caenorhabditis elegans]